MKEKFWVPALLTGGIMLPSIVTSIGTVAPAGASIIASAVGVRTAPSIVVSPSYDTSSPQAAFAGLPSRCGVIEPPGSFGLAGWAIARATSVRGLAIATVVAALLIAAFAAAPSSGADAQRAYGRTLYPAVAE